MLADRLLLDPVTEHLFLAVDRIRLMASWLRLIAACSAWVGASTSWLVT